MRINTVSAKQRMKAVAEKVVPMLYKRWLFRGLQRLDLPRDVDCASTIQPELCILPFILDRGRTALDVGANIGSFTFVLQEYLPSHNIIAVEPYPRSYDTLRRLFPGVRVFNLALSSQEGLSVLRVPVKNQQPISTRATLQNFREPGVDTYVDVQVKVVTLDEFTGSYGVSNIGFIKIDVEGHEYEVLKGGIRTIVENRPTLLIEIEQRHHAFDLKKVFDFVADLRYDGFFILPSEKRIVSVREFRPEEHQACVASQEGSYINNFFFAPRESASEFLCSAVRSHYFDGTLTR